MRSCGALSDTKAKEVDSVGAVGFAVSSNGGVGLAFLQAEHLNTLEVGTTSTEFVTAMHVEDNLL
jgi:hypothetical protein